MDFCSIASGSSGNCIYVGSDQTSVLIDTGISRKRIVDGLHEIDRKPEELKGILITHEHSDHIKGLGVMSRKYHIPIYATAGTIDGIRNSTSLGQIDEDLFHTIRADGKFQIEDLEVEPFAISHDAADVQIPGGAGDQRHAVQGGGAAESQQHQVGLLDEVCQNGFQSVPHGRFHFLRRRI